MAQQEAQQRFQQQAKQRRQTQLGDEEVEAHVDNFINSEDLSSDDIIEHIQATKSESFVIYIVVILCQFVPKHFRRSTECMHCQKENPDGLINCGSCMQAVHMACHNPRLAEKPNIFLCEKCVTRQNADVLPNTLPGFGGVRIHHPLPILLSHSQQIHPTNGVPHSQQIRPTNASQTATAATASSATTSAAGRKRKSIPLDLHANPVYVESMNGKHRVVSQNHGRNWVNADSNTVFGDVAKAPPKMAWHQRSPLGDKIGPGNRDYENMSRLDAFLLMFPPAQLEHCRKLTETKLKGTNPEEKLTTQELVRWMGICLLITRINYTGRRGVYPATTLEADSSEKDEGRGKGRGSQICPRAL